MFTRYFYGHKCTFLHSVIVVEAKVTVLKVPESLNVGKVRKNHITPKVGSAIASAGKLNLVGAEFSTIGWVVLRKCLELVCVDTLPCHS
jgi:hypothetical protein